MNQRNRDSKEESSGTTVSTGAVKFPCDTFGLTDGTETEVWTRLIVVAYFMVLVGLLDFTGLYKS